MGLHAKSIGEDVESENSSKHMYFMLVVLNLYFIFWIEAVYGARPRCVQPLSPQ